MSFKVMPITYTVGIGNSDDKLSQDRWSEFVDGLGQVLAELNVDIHFFGFSNPASSWQSCSAVFNAEATREVNDDIRGRLAVLAREFGQDSIALTVGTTTFVKAAS
jgi:hypothetical protein